jgi:protein tyrosine phosphatase
MADRRKRRRVPWIIAAVVAAALVGGWLYWTRSTYHLETVQAGTLYRCGLQSFREFENALRRVKPKTVVTLVDDRELADPEKPQFKREVEIFADASRGVKVVRVQIPLGGWPEGDQVDRFLRIAQDPANQPVMVHCAQGVRRTGMIVAAYQMSVLGYDKEKAKAAVLTFGHSDRTVNDVMRFIDTYDPQTRRMTKALPQSKE